MRAEILVFLCTLVLSSAAPIASSDSAEVSAGSLLALVAMVALIALCASKKDDSLEKIDPTPVQQKSNLVLLKDTTIALEERSENVADELDEDALANARIEAQSHQHDATNHTQMHLESSGSEWLHHSTRRKEAEEMIIYQARESKHGGIFLVRAKKEDQGQYALDVAWYDSVTDSVTTEHRLITRGPAGFQVDDQVFEKCNTLESLIAYLRKPKNKILKEPLFAYIPAPANDSQSLDKPQSAV